MCTMVIEFGDGQRHSSRSPHCACKSEHVLNTCLGVGDITKVDFNPTGNSYTACFHVKAEVINFADRKQGNNGDAAK